jgi:uroporphyrinogen-III synthase
VRIIVTRPAAQAQAWVHELRGRGLDAVALPLIAIGAAADPVVVLAAWEAVSENTLVVFVSPNAVEQFFALAPEGIHWPAGTLAGSLGPGTTRELRARAVPASVIVEPAADSPQFDSEALWAQLSARPWQGRSALIVRGDGGRDWLADTLRSTGARVELVAAYRRVASRPDAAQRELLAAAVAAPGEHLWLFSSSEAIDRLAALRPDLDAQAWRAAHAIATHPRIAERARTLGIGAVHSSRPGIDDVTACIQSIRP